jgi:mannose-1-phosphate guanylyltransferase/mannose-6-phosphate isomerase
MSTFERDGSFASVVPVILSGGSGSRLWPMSRADRPKQFLPLVSDKTMIQETALRVAEAHGFATPVVVCAADHCTVVEAQLGAVTQAHARLILEPLARNTAPAIAAAAVDLARRKPDTLMLVLPADHHIADPAGLRTAIGRALGAARSGYVVTFGMLPTVPETGYGYILPDGPVENEEGVRRIATFVEKPPLELARAFLEGGRHLWNAGMFLFAVPTILEALRRHAPEVLAAAEAAVAGGREERGTLRLDPEAFARAPSISFDHAVMEKTDGAAVVAAAIGWTDVGSWSSLWEIGARDDDGNVTNGHAMAIGTRNSFVHGDGIPTAAIGLDDLIVVGSRDGILVAHRDRAQDVRSAAAAFDGAAARFPMHRLRTITIDPGAARRIDAPADGPLSLTIVSGTGALAVGGAAPEACGPGTVCALPAVGTATIENDGPGPLTLIEIAIGPARA